MTMMTAPTSELPAEPRAEQGSEGALALLRILGQELLEHSRRTPLSNADRGVLQDLARQLLRCASETQAPPPWASVMSQELMACARRPQPIKMGALQISIAG